MFASQKCDYKAETPKAGNLKWCVIYYTRVVKSDVLKIIISGGPLHSTR